MSDALWIILTGALVGATCSLVGCFMVLRRMAMLGDAISHAVLPGIAIAFLITRSISSYPILIGATVLGVLTAILVQALTSTGRVRADAAIGVTFTSLFALGVVLVSQISLHDSSVDLDTDCVLYGIIEYVPLNTLTVAGREIGPQAFWQMLLIFAVTATVVTVLFKELKVAAFDPEMATAVGINATAMHYILMALVSLTTVGAFEPVGAILVVAMLVVPPLTAYLLVDDLLQMILVSIGCAIVAAILGFYMAQQLDSSTAGAMTVVSGILFTTALFFSPRHGYLMRLLHQRRLAHQIAREDLLQALWRISETGASGAPVTAANLSRLSETEQGLAQRALEELRRSNLVQGAPEGFTLTAAGMSRAQELVHRHRVYETYLDNLGYPGDHLHGPADRVEHFLTGEMLDTVAAAAGNPTTDPHGKSIPSRPT